MTSAPVPDLFDPVDPLAPGVEVTLGGEHDHLDGIASGYRGAADVLASAWLADPNRSPLLAFPILQTYRHAIELGLKASCQKVADLVSDGASMGFGRNSVPEDLPKRMHGHSITRLVELYYDLAEGLSVNPSTAQLPPETDQTLRNLHRWDATGTYFRYVTDLQRGESRPIRPDPVTVDLSAGITRLSDAARMLEYGLGGFLAAYSDYLSLIRYEYEANLEQR